MSRTVEELAVMDEMNWRFQDFLNNENWEGATGCINNMAHYSEEDAVKMRRQLFLAKNKYLLGNKDII